MRILKSNMKSKFFIVSQPKSKILRRRTPPPPHPPSSGDKQWGETDIRLEYITNPSILSSMRQHYVSQATWPSIQTVYLLIRSDEKVCKFKRYTNNRSNKGLTLETSAFLPFTVANLRFQLSC